MFRYPRLHEALDYAAEAHSAQSRKGTSNPYLSHPIGVASLVLETGGSEDEAIAALLHDVLEDCGIEHEPQIRTRFGDRAADIVLACTDGLADETGEKPPWRQRKLAYLEHLRDAEPGALLVSACDKLHNARSIASDALAGQAVFERFKAGRDGTIWYYQSLAEVLGERLGSRHSVVLQLNVAIAQFCQTSRETLSSEM